MELAQYSLKGSRIIMSYLKEENMVLSKAMQSVDEQSSVNK